MDYKTEGLRSFSAGKNVQHSKYRKSKNKKLKN